MLNSIIRFFLHNKLFAFLFLLLFSVWGLINAPFNFHWSWLPRDPVPVDAIPDIGENQQIVFTEWPGRSPTDVENQISYPLTTALLGLPGVKNVRSNSMFGFSSIYIIFEDKIDFYWSRSRILEKLNALPPQLLPQGVQPSLGPDATGLGQIYWYTLEGRDERGKPTGGWDPHELRSIQDYYVRYGLASARGVAEVASIGGYVKEYQVDIDPDKLRIYNIPLEQVMDAIRQSNIDVGAQTMEINLAEYFVRGLGYVKKIEDIEQTVVTVNNNIPIRIGDLAHVNIGPAARRGILDKGGAEAVGGVVVARFGSNPMDVIRQVKERIKEIEPGLPSKMLANGTRSSVKIIPFYDRSGLIQETLGTLYSNLVQEILVTTIVIILLLFNLRASLVVSGLLPIAVLMTFIAMKFFGVDANIVALSGIAIAIGTMVDVGIVMSEGIVHRIENGPPEETILQRIDHATTEVGGAMVAAVLTTIVSFLPVFALEGAEGKLFRPLAFTKTFALGAAIALAIIVLPALAHAVFSFKKPRKLMQWLIYGLLGVGAVFLSSWGDSYLAMVLGTAAVTGCLSILLHDFLPVQYQKYIELGVNLIYAGMALYLIADMWMPLGARHSFLTNFLVVAFVIGGLLGFLYWITLIYRGVLQFFLAFKALFLLIPVGIVTAGFFIFQHTGQEFMPALDEGSFLLMPTAMPHAGSQEVAKNLRLLDMAATAIPEVEHVVGKAGRVESALDPAPLGMYENLIAYKSEYKTDEDGRRQRFKVDAQGKYVYTKEGNLILDPKGQYFRQWRDHIHTPNDIWNEITRATTFPGLTSAPKLQPIQTRLIMLQTGMRAPMGIKIKGPDLATIEAFGLELEKLLREVEGVKDAAVFADRIVGKPYLELEIDRAAIARHGLSIAEVQNQIETALGGTALTQTVEGRERYAIRLRYPRELRNDPELVQRIFIPSKSSNAQIPLSELTHIQYRQGPQMIKSEDGFLVGYVLFDKEDVYAEMDVVKNAQKYLTAKIAAGALTVPKAVSYRFAGNYENNVRANQRLAIILPLTLLIILLIQYLEFRSVILSLMVFTGVIVAFAGGFILIWLYGQSWFLDVNLLGENLRTLFQVHQVNLSVAVWVGFLALFGIVTDDGVLMATYLKERFHRDKPNSIADIRSTVVDGAMRRIRPAMMVTATTLLGFLPILTSTGRGSDIMAPMAIPAFGGLFIEMISIFIVPVLFCLWQEWRWRFQKGGNHVE